MRIANDVSKKGPLQKKTSAGNPETVDFEELPGENKGMVWNKLCVFSGLWIQQIPPQIMINI